MKALSIVAPSGTKIAEGEKTIEVRSWKPTIDLDKRFLIVENSKYLNEDGDFEEEALAVAYAKIKCVRKFTKEDVEKACASYWTDGYYSWDLYDIKKIQNPFRIIAKRGFYDL